MENATNATLMNTAAEDTTPMEEDNFVIVDGVPAAAAATADHTAPAAADVAAVELSCSAGLREYASGEAHEVQALISLVVPEGPESDDSRRLPLEVVAVVDRSGSMHGQKMKMMKQTLDFLVTKGLKTGDTFGIVTFDHNVETALPLTKMSASTRPKASAAVGALRVGGSTNLSGGLLQGIDELNRSNVPQGEATRAVLIFTDGLANNGITETSMLLDAVKGAMGAQTKTIFSFGFGAGHNEDMLRALADLTSGLYYFIDKEDDIPQAFSDCLGGLTSVAGQNAQLRIEANPLFSHIGRVRGCPKAELDQAQLCATVPLGDLYAEDEKDVLISLKLPALNEPTPEAAPVLQATLRYFSVYGRRMEEVSTKLALARPAEAAPDAEQPVNIKLDEQINRVEVAEAMAEAAAMADQGSVAEGRERLRMAKEGAMRSASATTPMVRELCGDLERCAEGYTDQVAYRSLGSKMTKMSSACHAQQRSNHVSAQIYTNKGKQKMKAAWFGGGPDSV